MKLLVLGGTKFLGRAVAEEALARGHELTLFNRGETNPELFPGTEKLRGDRGGDLSALEGRTWDVVVDPSGYVPRVVRASAGLLTRNGIERYVFVSTIGAYATPFATGFDEAAPLAELDDPATEDVSEHYGALKAACERVVEELFSERSILVRAGLIVGPNDPTDRFTYWPTRIARGGRVLAPGPSERPWQFIDARDLAALIVHVAEEQEAGAFNVTGPVGGTTAGEVLETCRQVAGSDAELVWVDEAFLVERQVGEWMELPLWVADSNAEIAHLHEADTSRAISAGLATRPIADTVRDTLAWAQTRAKPGEGTAVMGGTEGVGLEPGREVALLDEWDARR
jgi:nucleoside-diphosphate-sugar epimerase